MKLVERSAANVKLFLHLINLDEIEANDLKKEVKNLQTKLKDCLITHEEFERNNNKSKSDMEKQITELSQEKKDLKIDVDKLKQNLSDLAKMHQRK